MLFDELHLSVVWLFFWIMFSDYCELAYEYFKSVINNKFNIISSGKVYFTMDQKMQHTFLLYYKRQFWSVLKVAESLIYVLAKEQDPETTFLYRFINIFSQTFVLHVSPAAILSRHLAWPTLTLLCRSACALIIFGT